MEARQMLRRHEAPVRNEVDHLVGSVWGSVLWNSGSYSGLRIAGLAELVGGSVSSSRRKRRAVRDWHDLVYSYLCGIAHVDNTLSELDASSTDDELRPKWISTHGEINATMQMANAFFLVSLKLLDDEFDLGPAFRTAVDGLGEELEALERKKP